MSSPPTLQSSEAWRSEETEDISLPAPQLGTWLMALRLGALAEGPITAPPRRVALGTPSTRGAPPLPPAVRLPPLAALAPAAAAAPCGEGSARACGSARPPRRRCAAAACCPCRCAERSCWYISRMVGARPAPPSVRDPVEGRERLPAEAYGTSALPPPGCTDRLEAREASPAPAA